MQRSLTVSGLANARDLGGLERSDGTLTPYGVFIRAEMLDRVDAAGWDTLRSLGVRSVIDLRRPHETTSVAPADIHFASVDLDGDEREFWDPVEVDGRWGTPLYYADHLRTLPHRLRGVLDAVASAPDGAVLFHCRAGWDRTGLVAAVLLKALDVTPDAATDDYVASFANAERLEELHDHSAEVEERLEILARFEHTPESAFRAAYRDLDIDEWFARARVEDSTRVAVSTWRGRVTGAVDGSAD